MATGKSGEKQIPPVKVTVEKPKGPSKSASKSYNDGPGPLGMRQTYKQTGKVK